MAPIAAPWTAVLTRGEYDLILFAMVATLLALLATLVRVRFTTQEAHGTFQVASLTANAVVAIAAVSYAALIAAHLLGYREVDGVMRPLEGARYAWALRYMDWVVTVPLLVLELVAISAIADHVATRVRRVGMVAAALMVVLGFLGAFVVADGRDPALYTLLGLGGSVCFVTVYVMFFVVLRRSLPRLPGGARQSYRAAVVVLLLTWFVYPIVYGFSGAAAGAGVAVAGQLLLCAADMVAKIGFGTLVHRTAVLRSRNDEDLDPARCAGRARPRTRASTCATGGWSTSTRTDPPTTGPAGTRLRPASRSDAASAGGTGCAPVPSTGGTAPWIRRIAAAGDSRKASR